MNDNSKDEAGEHWCGTQRQQVLAYLSSEGFESPNVGDWP